METGNTSYQNIFKNQRENQLLNTDRIIKKTSTQKLDIVKQRVYYLMGKNLNIDAYNHLTDYINQEDIKFISLPNMLSQSKSENQQDSDSGEENIILEVSKLCNELFVKLTSLKIYINQQQNLAKNILGFLQDRNTVPFLQLKSIFLSNFSIYLISTHSDISLAIKCLRQASKIEEILYQQQKSNPQTLQYSVINNNLAVLYILLECYELAEDCLYKSVSASEAYIFSITKKFHQSFLQKDNNFKQKLIILIFGYLYFELLEKKKKSVYNESEMNIQSNSNQDPAFAKNQNTENNYLKNAYNLAKKYLGEDHSLSKVITKYIKQQQNQAPIVQNSMVEQDDFEQFKKILFPYYLDNSNVQNWAIVHQLTFKKKQQKQLQFMQTPQQKIDLFNNQFNIQQKYKKRQVFKKLSQSSINSSVLTRCDSIKSLDALLDTNQFQSNINQCNSMTHYKQKNLENHNQILELSSIAEEIKSNLQQIKEAIPPQTEKSHRKSLSQINDYELKEKLQKIDQYKQQLVQINENSKIQIQQNQDMSNLKQMLNQAFFCQQELEKKVIMKIHNIKLNKAQSSNNILPSSQHNTSDSQQQQQINQDSEEIKEQEGKQQVKKQNNFRQKMYQQKYKQLQKSIHDNQIIPQEFDSSNNSNKSNQNESLNNKAHDTQNNESSISNDELINEEILMKFVQHIDNQHYAETLLHKSESKDKKYILRSLFYKDQKLITQKNFQLPELNQLANYNFQDILPNNSQIYQLKDQQELSFLFTKYFIKFDKFSRQIQLTTIPISQAPTQYFDFNKIQCKMFVYHIDNNYLRIILRQEQNNDLVFQFDLDFDQKSYQYLFGSEINISNNNKIYNEFKNRFIDAIIKSQDSSQLISEQCYDIENIYQQLKISPLKLKDNLKNINDGFRTVSQQNYFQFTQQKDEDKFSQFLRENVLKVEQFVLSNIQQNDFDYINKQDTYYLSIKIHDNNQRSSMYFLSYKNTENQIKIFIKNNFQSFGIGGSQIFAQGQDVILLDDISQKFGLNFINLSQREQQIVMAYYTNLYSLQTIDKLEQSLRLDKAQYLINPIQKLPFICAGYKRLIINDSPCTISIIGTQNILFGIKYTIYDCQSAIERGIFYSCNNYLQKFLYNSDTNNINKPRQQKKNIDQLPLQQHLITQLFQNLVAPIINQQINVVKREDQLIVELNESCKSSDQLCNINILDNVLNYEQLNNIQIQ